VSELRFEDVTVRFGSRLHRLTAVDQVSLTVPDGEVVGLVGESGSGKSTLARAAVGLVPVHSGRILLDGRPLPQRRGRRPVQMVFQDPYSSLDPRMRIGATIAEAIPRDAPVDRRAEVARLLELVGLDPAGARAYPGQLSGGQRQRVALARALGARPEVIVADEITSALDVSIQGTVLNLVRTLHRELGMSMLFISHNLAVVRYMASSIAVMYLGRIVEHGPAEQVLGDPQHPYTRELLAAVPGEPVPPERTDQAGPATRTGPAGESIAGPSTGQPGEPAAEPADPHHPPGGCRYHPRCPVGPLVRPDREICRTTDPPADRRHAAACHFAAPPDRAAAGPGQGPLLVQAGRPPTHRSPS
jgi:peptide/nickel transport system ATP-binding protein